MKKMTVSIRNKIKLMIKNKIDLSDILKEYDLHGEDLTRAIIKEFNRPNDDLSYINLTKAIIGEHNKITHLSGATLYGANMKDSTFLGKVWLRHCNAQYSTWDGANVSFVDYQHSNFEHASFCETIWRMGSRCGYGAKISESLIKKWGITICKESKNGTKTE